MKKHKRKIFLIIGVILLVFCFVLLKLRGYRILQSRTFRKFYDRIDFKIDTKELKIPEDALSFSVYDIDKEEYLFYEGGGQLPTVASLSKLFAIDYALTKVKLEDRIEVNQELLDLVPQGSSMAHLKPGKYTAEQIMQAMLVPSGNDAAFALAYNIGKKDLGDGYSAKKYVNYFVKNLSKYLADEGYNKTHLFDPSGFSTQADTNLKDINRVALKLI
ncbi:MAG: serine hydrolase, partial [Finegoldia magna]|nr:serine hydrolase [Finegoldia magna]